MSYSCRGHHWCPVTIFPIYQYFVLFKNLEIIVCKQDNNPIGITLFNGRTMFAPTTVSHNTIYKLLLFMLQNIVVFWIVQSHSLQFTQGHSIHFFIIYNIPTSPNLLKCFQLRTIKIKKLIYLGFYYWQFYLILINSKSPQYNLDIGRKIATPSKGFAGNLRFYYIYKKAKSSLLP